MFTFQIYAAKTIFALLVFYEKSFSLQFAKNMAR